MVNRAVASLGFVSPIEGAEAASASQSVSRPKARARSLGLTCYPRMVVPAPDALYSSLREPERDGASGTIYKTGDKPKGRTVRAPLRK